MGVLLLEMSLTITVAAPAAAASMGSLVLSCAEVGRGKNWI